MIAKKIGLLAATAMVAGIALAPTAARASVDGKRNTAIALGLGTLYELSQHNTGAAALLGVGTAVAAQQYEQDRHNQSVWRNDRGYYYRDRDRERGWDRDRDRGGYQYRDYDRDNRDRRW